MLNKILKISVLIVLTVVFATTQTSIVFADDGCTDALNRHQEVGNTWWGECMKGVPYKQSFICRAGGKIDVYDAKYFDSCLQGVQPAPGVTTSGIGNIFGKITAPGAIQKLAGGNPSGATGISAFLNNLISLIYIFAAIALLFMLLWGAFDWITSEGDKEKIKSAQNKIINAIVGIMLFAVAFAILSVLGAFTGFRFFVPTSPSWCTQREEYYWEDSAHTTCTFKYFAGKECKENFQTVDNALCKKNP